MCLSLIVYCHALQTEINFSTFGIDWDGPAPDEEIEGTVVLPEISIDLDDEETEQLHSILDIVVSTENSELEWIAKYIECRRFIHDRAN